MNVLMLYPKLPFPPNKGEKMRAYEQVKYIAGRHKVWLACFVDSADDYQHVNEIRTLCHAVEFVPLNKKIALSRGGFNLLRGKTVTEGYYGSQAMWRVVEMWKESNFFDVALAFSSSMGAYIEDLPCGRRILDMNDFDSRKWEDYSTKSTWPMSSMFKTEANRLAVRELELIQKCDLTLMVNERECDKLARNDLRTRLAVFRTPIDISRYVNIREIHRDKIVGYVGTLSYRPNIESVLWFARHVWPLVQRQHPDARWWIVGRDPNRDVRRLAEDPTIKVTGQVEDVLQYLARMRVFIAPVQSEMGIQTKALEAMAAGRPTVVTPFGHQGIQAADQRDYVVADAPQDFARALGDLLSDHPRCVEMGKYAIDFIRRCYGSHVLMPEFENLLVGQPVAEEVTL